MAAKKGKPSQVLVQEEDSSFREEWSYDRDPTLPHVTA
jgi:hypothetical protein